MVKGYMKLSIKPPLSVAIAGMIATSFAILPTLRADENSVKIKDDKIIVKTDDGKAKIDKDGNVISVSGKNGAAALAKARAELSAEEAVQFRQSLIEGYVIPQDRYVYLDPVPQTNLQRIPNPRPDVEYRAYNGTVYAVNPKTYTVVEVLGTDIMGNTVTTTTTTQDFDAVSFKKSLVRGYAVPQTYYTTYLQAVPETIVPRLPQAAGVTYRYYDGTVYSVDPNTYTILEVVTY